jgi:hypothetical protein
VAVVFGTVLGANVEVLERAKPTEHEDQHPDSVQEDGGGYQLERQPSVAAKVRYPPPDGRPQACRIENKFDRRQADDPALQHPPGSNNDDDRPGQQNRDPTSSEDRLCTVRDPRRGGMGKSSRRLGHES